MTFTFLNLLEIIGALGFFIFGMKVMSEGIQKVAGQKMRAFLRAMTSNRFLGLGTGFLITSLLQSSSATTVMTVSFVNAGLLSLTESIGVIMGANIGTTITAWLISLFGFKFKIAAITLPIIGVAFPFMFSRNEIYRNWAEFAIGFALLFMGLDALKNSVPDLGANPEALAFLASYSNLGFASTIIFVLVGTLLTLIVQSSSAAMALTIVMCNEGWIPFEAAAAIVLGENIGTTVTANLAAIVGNVYAKRAARAHLMFNIFGVAWMLLVFDWFLKGVDGYVVRSEGLSAFETAAVVPIALSVFHSAFNIINAFILIWFVPQIETIVTKLVKVKKDDDTYFNLEYIGGGLMKTPELSILEAKKEIAKFSKLLTNMFDRLNMLLYEKDKKKFNKELSRIENYEEITDRLEVEISKYLVNVSAGEMSASGTNKLRSMLIMVSELEDIADCIYQMSKTFETKQKEKAWFTPEQRDNIHLMFQKVQEILLLLNKNLEGEYEQIILEKAGKLEDELNTLRNDLRKSHIKSIEKKDYNVRAGMLYVDLFSSAEKIGDYAISVTEAAKGKY
jgi:phosphate:Na+ symporter